MIRVDSLRSLQIQKNVIILNECRQWFVLFGLSNSTKRGQIIQHSKEYANKRKCSKTLLLRLMKCTAITPIPTLHCLKSIVKMIVRWLMKVVVSVTNCRLTLATSADAYFDCHFRDNPDLSKSWLLPVIRDTSPTQSCPSSPASSFP